MIHHQLAMEEPRLFEEFRLEQSDPTRIKEITVVESAYDSVLCKDFTYVSTPITSGAILYKALDDAGLKDLDLLRQDKAYFYQHVIKPNIDAAELVAHTMLSLGGAVIAPAAFEAKSLGWGQDEYMGLWLDTIERKATRLAMVDGWEYSNGGCEEYLQALLMQAGRRDRNTIAIVDAQGKTIRHDTALQLMSSAITNLLNRGFTPITLIRVLHRCCILHTMVASESDYGICTDTCGKQSFIVSPHYNDASIDKHEMRAFSYKLRGEMTKFHHLLHDKDKTITSSLDLYPGLIRHSDRAELTERPSKVIRLEE